jgi:riboflavin-specific deaminase-like protein
VDRLFPDPGPTNPQQQYTDLRLGELADNDRPYLVTNFAVTVDGRATIEGRSGPIGSDTDTEVLHLLRTQADAVMIGAGTMRTERYGRIVPDPELRGMRERSEGLGPDPLAVIVSGSLDLPWDAGLFTCGFGEVQILTSSEEPVPETATSVRVERHTSGEGVDLISAFRELRQQRGVRSVLCEGGPRLHANLIERGLVDELFVTTAPKLAGGEAPSLLEGAPPVTRDLEPVWLCEADGELFARYRVRG